MDFLLCKAHPECKEDTTYCKDKIYAHFGHSYTSRMTVHLVKCTKATYFYICRNGKRQLYLGFPEYANYLKTVVPVDRSVGVLNGQMVFQHKQEYFQIDHKTYRMVRPFEYENIKLH